MKIALDYDGTYTASPDFWDHVIGIAIDCGHDIRIVTARSPTLDVIDEPHLEDLKILYCDGVAKRFACMHFHDFEPDVWIDDSPTNIDNNSVATKEWLMEWRAKRQT